jgi:hypothetical protein
MCFDFKTSVTTFTIGTIFNIIGIMLYKKFEYLPFAIFWQWVLLMQVFEAIAWKTQNCNKTNKEVAKLAFVVNVTQPIILYMSFILISKVSINFKLISTMVISLYIIQTIYQSTNIEFKCLQPKKDCKHLDYYWLHNKLHNKVYLITALCMFLFLCRPLVLSMVNLVYLIITIIISSIIYTCGDASIWCWFSACAPLINIIAYKYI